MEAVKMLGLWIISFILFFDCNVLMKEDHYYQLKEHLVAFSFICVKVTFFGNIFEMYFANMDALYFEIHLECIL